jgi:hypothetical protein
LSAGNKYRLPFHPIIPPSRDQSVTAKPYFRPSPNNRPALQRLFIKYAHTQPQLAAFFNPVVGGHCGCIKIKFQSWNLTKQVEFIRFSPRSLSAIIAPGTRLKKLSTPGLPD